MASGFRAGLRTDIECLEYRMPKSHDIGSSVLIIIKPVFIEKDVINFSTSPKKKSRWRLNLLFQGAISVILRRFLTRETVVLTLMKAIFFQMSLLRYFL